MLIRLSSGSFNRFEGLSSGGPILSYPRGDGERSLNPPLEVGLEGAFHLGESRQVSVLLGQEGAWDRPLDLEVRVIPTDPDLVGSVVKIRAFVFHIGKGAEHAKAVQKTGRQVELEEVVA